MHFYKGSKNFTIYSLLSENFLLFFAVVFDFISQKAEIWKDAIHFKEFAEASIKLCDAYVSIASCSSCFRELVTAKHHLWIIMKQARYLSFYGSLYSPTYLISFFFYLLEFDIFRDKISLILRNLETFNLATRGLNCISRWKRILFEDQEGTFLQGLSK